MRDLLNLRIKSDYPPPPPGYSNKYTQNKWGNDLILLLYVFALYFQF